MVRSYSAAVVAGERLNPCGDFACPDHGLGVCEASWEYRPRRPEESVLYGVVAGNLETFLARQRERGRLVPRFVERELRAFLDCGILVRGFLRVHCDVCRLDRLVPYSCKHRGFCPSCGGRRMTDTAAHLVDHVFPEVPVRQWVLSLPFALRYRLAYDSSLVTGRIANLRARRLRLNPPPGRHSSIDPPGALWRRHLHPALQRRIKCRSTFPYPGVRWHLHG